MATHHYRLETTWTGDRGTGTSGYRDYDRDVTLRAAGKPDLLGSADKPFRGDPSRWNPEELLLAALSQCHLLSYLHVAVTHGVVVTGYRDAATGSMEQQGIGGRFTEVVLHPEVTVADPAHLDLATRIHAEASAACFIAASVAFPVRHEPVTRSA
ncbi:OsmC family protein [Nocardioides aurantiacus]|uniref:Organic hydroperoxide reductase OsmC/OhrA n=1 Tax=Nocardioides aurantiacus TaxID=86796 RepID=A0A3N2CY53_9ACTN|nr:OsmC family protein [Nocardioides aurantiacus]ROR92460.1 organic hydroperoxide reductase OsmC/OhrA [Nocardioides aurantiacus]